MTKRTEKGPRLFEFDAQGRMDDEEVCRRLGVEGSAADPDEPRSVIFTCPACGAEGVTEHRGPVADLPAPEPLTSDQKYWLARRADIIAALEARGLQIWSDKDRVWLHDMSVKPA